METPWISSQSHPQAGPTTWHCGGSARTSTSEEGSVVQRCPRYRAKRCLTAWRQETPSTEECRKSFQARSVACSSDETEAPERGRGQRLVQRSSMPSSERCTDGLGARFLCCLCRGPHKAVDCPRRTRDEAMAIGMDGEQEDPERQVMGCVARRDREEWYEQAEHHQKSLRSTSLWKS